MHLCRAFFSDLQAVPEIHAGGLGIGGFLFRLAQQLAATIQRGGQLRAIPPTAGNGLF